MALSASPSFSRGEGNSLVYQDPFGQGQLVLELLKKPDVKYFPENAQKFTEIGPEYEFPYSSRVDEVIYSLWNCAAKGSSCQEALSDLASELPDRVELESPAQN
ncbi:Elongation factor Tu GTP binding domain family protein [Aspergillus niger]|uniref:Elongation factor Tu GTP binding domain family protein n=1 Tax=Aspergillus niger TaxID=5061 RepID=A0A505I934_ASPNG|nr:Elongation factor Tu GTP binding domain family protein [Aspergillus niger]